MMRRLFRWLFVRERLLRIDVWWNDRSHTEFHLIPHFILRNIDANVVTIVAIKQMNLEPGDTLIVVNEGWMSRKLVWLIESLDVDVVSPGDLYRETGDDDDE